MALPKHWSCSMTTGTQILTRTRSGRMQFSTRSSEVRPACDPPTSWFAKPYATTRSFPHSYCLADYVVWKVHLCRCVCLYCACFPNTMTHSQMTSLRSLLEREIHLRSTMTASTLVIIRVVCLSCWHQTSTIEFRVPMFHFA